jgi:superfamily II DNA or RNA helicase
LEDLVEASGFENLSSLPPPPDGVKPVTIGIVPVREVRRQAEDLVLRVREIVRLRIALVEQVRAELSSLALEGDGEGLNALLNPPRITEAHLSMLAESGLRTLDSIIHAPPRKLASVTGLDYARSSELILRARQQRRSSPGEDFLPDLDRRSNKFVGLLKSAHPLVHSRDSYRILNGCGAFVEHIESAVFSADLEAQHVLIEAFESPTWLLVEKHLDALERILLAPTPDTYSLWGDYKERKEDYDKVIEGEVTQASRGDEETSIESPHEDRGKTPDDNSVAEESAPQTPEEAKEPMSQPSSPLPTFESLLDKNGNDADLSSTKDPPDEELERAAEAGFPQPSNAPAPEVPERERVLDDGVWVGAEGDVYDIVFTPEPDAPEEGEDTGPPEAEMPSSEGDETAVSDFDEDDDDGGEPLDSLSDDDSFEEGDDGVEGAPPEEDWVEEELDEVEESLWRSDLAEVDLTRGGLPAELEASIEEFPLDLSGLRDVTLRGYQAFGAKFALHQKRVIVGDAMGLGKTLEAITAMVHLDASGENRFLVVCPASVMTNWAAEVERFSGLKPVLLHGEKRYMRHYQWKHHGGVGITTHDTLGSFKPEDDFLPHLLVVDEAHLVKNRRTHRAHAVAQWTEKVDRVMFLTGTPIENRVEEFRSLVGFINADVAKKTRDFEDVSHGKKFREAIAAVYLRRSQKDVLTELPEKVEVEEWLPMKKREQEIYRRAVASGNFMNVRRASFAAGTATDSAKIERLKEIAEEAMEQGRKVIAFSFFKDNLHLIENLFGDRSMPRLHGQIPASKRQAIINNFEKRADPAILPAQIDAIGIGLNIQAASVVILCEPQWKPSTEEQAIARAHRMGQKETVYVYRLLSEGSVDVYMRQIVLHKQKLVSEFVPSEVSRMFKGALDVAEFESISNTFDVQGKIIEMEKKRLSLPE